MIKHSKLLSDPLQSNVSSQPRSNRLIIVLWAAQFDPVAAAIFVAELRKLGLHVKIVSLSMKKMPGNNGLALYHDMTLSEAFNMIGKISGIIVPCRLAGAQYFRNDPRASRLFREASLNEIPIVIGHMDQKTLSTLRLFPKDMINDLILYPEIEDLIEFAHHLAYSFWLPPKQEM